MTIAEQTITPVTEHSVLEPPTQTPVDSLFYTQREQRVDEQEDVTATTQIILPPTVTYNGGTQNGGTQNSDTQNSDTQNGLTPHTQAPIRAAMNGHEPEPIYVSEADYWATYYNHPDINYEWNNGKLEEKPTMTSVAKFEMYSWLIYALQSYLLVAQNATMVGLELGFRLPRLSWFAGRQTSIRKPDMGVVLHTNPVPLYPHDKTYGGIFDLCIESLSDSNQTQIDRDVVDKFTEYAQAGVREYYILDDHRNRHMAFYRLNARGVYVRIRPVMGDVIRSIVLPGFQFRLRDLYRQPLPIQMVNDPIYQHFILTEYQQERLRAQRAEQQALQEAQRANQETQRANQETQRANQETQRADEAEARMNQYAERLRSLGIDPEA